MATKKSDASSRATTAPASKKTRARAIDKAPKVTMDALSGATPAAPPHKAGDRVSAAPPMAKPAKASPVSNVPVPCVGLQALRVRIESAGKDAIPDPQRNTLVKALAGLEAEYSRLRGRY